MCSILFIIFSVMATTQTLNVFNTAFFMLFTNKKSKKKPSLVQPSPRQAQSTIFPTVCMASAAASPATSPTFIFR